MREVYRRLLLGGVILVSARFGDLGADGRKPIVSLVALIANPKAHTGQTLVTAGFCSLEFEDTAVYLHEEDYRKALPMNSIWLDAEPTRAKAPKKEHEKYCLVEATFKAEPARNGRAGRLERVTRLEILPSRQEFAARAKEQCAGEQRDGVGED
jgi:hypothetical protein